MNRPFLHSVIALLFFVSVQSQEKLTYETGVTLIEKGLVFLEQEKYDEAVKTFEEISPNDSLYASSFVTRSYYNHLQEKYNESLKDVEEGLKVAESDTRRLLYLNKGVAYEGLESYDLAKEVYLEALKEFPRDHKLRYNLSIINEKLGEKEEAFNNLILVLESNPFFHKAMLQLGNMYRKQNKRAQALLLYNMYLLLSPDGENSFAVLQMANEMVGNIDNLDGEIYPTTKDDKLFESYNLIIESQLALNKDFEIKNDVNVPFTKQTLALLNQMQEEPFKGESRLWSELVMPFFKWINENNHFSNLAYTTAYSIENDKFKKLVTKKTNDIKEFLPVANFKWTELSSKDKVAVSGKQTKVKRGYSDGLLIEEGEVNDKDEETGEWLYYNDFGQIIAKGNFVKGERDGNWEWYYENGELKEKGQYSKGIEEGKYEFFHDNGNRKYILYFKKGKLDGQYEKYALTGALQEKRLYKNGEMDGIRRFFYECDEDLLYYEYTIKEGKAEGIYKEFYPNGKLTKEVSLVNDSFQGEEKIYHYNGELASTSIYNEGDYDGPFTTYYDTGKIKSTGTYVDGKFHGEQKRYFSNGTLSKKYQHQAGKLEGSYLEYDRDGNLLSDYTYKNGLLKDYTYFDKEGNVIESQKRKSGELYYKGYNESRTLTAEGLYDIKGGKKGVWTYYNTYGVATGKGTYKEDETDGAYTIYYPNGEKKDISNYKDGVLEGYEVIYYPFGQMKSQSYYKEGSRDGRMIKYYPDGKIKAENYYHKGKLNGDQKYFDPTGRLKSITNYEFGVLMSETEYKEDRTILEKIDRLSPENNTLTYHYENGKTKSSSAFKYGVFHGPHKEYDFYGNLEAEAHYINDDLDGSVTTYYPGGEIETNRVYVNGSLEGPYMQYYKNGKVEDSTYYQNGLEKGISKYFNKKGIKTGELYYVKGMLHGARKFYGEENGTLQLIRHYNYGKLIGYSYLDTNNKEVPMIELPNGTGKITAYFPNGSKGREMTFEKGLNQGAYIAYYENGEIERKYNYVDNEIHGKTLRYYPDGTLKRETNYFHGYKQGVEKLFYENGNLKEENKYVNGKLEGDRHYYNQEGKKTKTEVYFNENIIKSQSF